MLSKSKATPRAKRAMSKALDADGLMVWAKQTLGYTFKKPALLEQAFTHGSSGAKADYERLEFLGDRVLGLAVVDMLYKAFPVADEGELGRRHSALVRAETLTRVAMAWQVGGHIRLALGQNLANLENAKILSDVVESILGAYYLDAGWPAVRKLIQKHWADFLPAMDGRDAKSMLQELMQSAKNPLPIYDVVAETGPDHAKEFTVRVTCVLGSAEGTSRSKHEAGKLAAAALLGRTTGGFHAE